MIDFYTLKIAFLCVVALVALILLARRLLAYWAGRAVGRLPQVEAEVRRSFRQGQADQQQQEEAQPSQEQGEHHAL